MEGAVAKVIPPYECASLVSKKNGAEVVDRVTGKLEIEIAQVKVRQLPLVE
jgi:hypothetical protein